MSVENSNTLAKSFPSKRATVGFRMQMTINVWTCLQIYEVAMHTRAHWLSV